MRGINKVILVGTLGKDPETRSFPNGGSITSFSIATSDAWTDKNTGERREQTEWHRISINIPRLGDIAQQYLRKGSKVYVEGSLHTRQWKDNETGQDRSITEVRCTQLQMLDSRQNNNGGWNNANGYPQDNYGNQGAYNQPYQSQGNYGGNGGYMNHQNNYQSGGYQSQQTNQGFVQNGQGFQNPNSNAMPAPTVPSAPMDSNDIGKVEDDDLPF